MKYVFGVDIGGTTVKLGFFDTEGNILEKWEIPTRKDLGGKYILPDHHDRRPSPLRKESQGNSQAAPNLPGWFEDWVESHFSSTYPVCWQPLQKDSRCLRTILPW